MEHKVLLATQDLDWAKEVKTQLQSKNISCEMVSQGRECQLLLYKTKFNLVILNPDITNHSGIEVLKFIKLNQPSLRVAVIFTNEERGREYEPLTKNSNRIGISKVFTGLASAKAILEYVQDNSPGLAWKNVDTSDLQEVPESKIRDKDCTQVDIESCLNGNTAIFDYYIRLKENHFVKIVKRGETIETERVVKLQQGGVKQLYFLTRERRNYINYMNDLLKTSLTSNRQSDAKVAMFQVSNISDKLMEEIHTRGLRPELIEEGKSLSNNIFSLLKSDDKMGGVNASFMEFDIEKLTHSFLTSFFSAIICKNLEWAGQKTMETVTMGAMLHDIGMMKLPPELREKHPDKMTSKELELYLDHPRLGANLLLTVPQLNPQIIQIVYQHHENNQGTGYPNKLSSTKIYPLAKIVALADEMADTVTENMISPLDAVKLILKDRDKLLNYDPLLVKALVAGFTTGRK